VLFECAQCGTGFRPGDNATDSLFGIHHHRHLAVQPAVAQALLHLLRFDPEAADLHLPVASATEDDTVSGPLRQVSTAIRPHSLAVGQRQGHERVIARLRGIHIPQAYPRTDDVQLAHHLFVHRLQVVVEDQYLAVGNGTAHVAIAVPRLQPPMGDQHRGFGGAVEVVQLALASQPLDHVGLADFTAGQQVLQAQGQIGRQEAEHRRR